MLRSSWVAAQLAASQVGLSSMSECDGNQQLHTGYLVERTGFEYLITSSCFCVSMYYYFVGRRHNLQYTRTQLNTNVPTIGQISICSAYIILIHHNYTHSIWEQSHYIIYLSTHSTSYLYSSYNSPRKTCTTEQATSRYCRGTSPWIVFKHQALFY
jgi:hypothetical protein